MDSKYKIISAPYVSRDGPESGAVELEENVAWTGNLTGGEEVNVADSCSSVT